MKASEHAAAYGATTHLQTEEHSGQSLNHKSGHQAEPSPERVAHYLARHTAADLQEKLQHLAGHQSNHTSARPELDLAHLTIMEQQLKNATDWLKRAILKEDPSDKAGALTEMEDLLQDTIHAETDPNSHLTCLDHLKINWPQTAKVLQPALLHGKNDALPPEFLDPEREPQPSDQQMLLHAAHAHLVSSEGWSPSHNANQAERLVRNLTSANSQAMSRLFQSIGDSADETECDRNLSGELAEYIHQVTMATRYLAENRERDFAAALTAATAHARKAKILAQPPE